MPDLTAETLANRIFDLGLLDTRQLENVWTDFGTRNVSAEDFAHSLVSRQLLTNFQVDKVAKGDREGYFYGAFRVLYIVGAGTFARVFRAVHRETGEVMAVKVLRKRYRNEPEQVELFLREARMGSRLRHENIVRVENVSSDIKAPYMVMEFVEGQTLREFLKVRHKFDVETSLSLITDITSGLDHARKRGITHRDMKLSNVLITATGQAKLVDFGLATISEENDKLLTAAPNARSIDYVALERGTNVRKNDHRSDIYFAGCIFYHMLTGVAPLPDTRDRLQRMSVSRFQSIKPVTQFEPDLPVGVQAILTKSMSLSPKDRYQEPEEMLLELKRAKYMLGKSDESEAAAAAVAAAAAETAAAGTDEVQVGDLEGVGKTVLIVESVIEMQNLLREQLKKRGYRVLIISDPARAIQRFEDDIRLADCAVFSAQELGTAALEAFNKLGEINSIQDTPAILMVESRQQALIKAAQTDEHRVLLAMPLKMKALRQKLIELIGSKDKR